jgi:hypothetical protein
MEGNMFHFLNGWLLVGNPIPEILVESHQDVEVFVAPTQVINNTNIPYQLDSTSVFGHTINDAGNARKLTQYGYVSMDGEVMVYNPDTIKFSWDNCNYSTRIRECSFENGHYLLESYITFDKQQVSVRLILYNELMIPVAQSVQTNTRIVKIIKREKTTRALIPMGGSSVSGLRKSCGPTSCSTARPTGNRGGGARAFSQTTKEDLEPTIVVVEPRLLDRDIQQASVRLWTSVKID